MWLAEEINSKKESAKVEGEQGSEVPTIVMAASGNPTIHSSRTHEVGQNASSKTALPEHSPGFKADR